MKTTKKTSEMFGIAEMQVSYAPEKNGIKFKGSQEAYKYFMEIWDQQLINLQEQCYVLFLNQQSELLTWKLINTGTTNQSTIDIKMILSQALTFGAQSIIVALNHPSGKLDYRDEDIEAFSNLNLACKIIQLNLQDCLIVTSDSHESIRPILVESDYQLKVHTGLNPLEKELIELVQFGNNTSDWIERVYDEVFFTDHDIESDLKQALWFTKELYKLIRKIENENKSEL